MRLKYLLVSMINIKLYNVVTLTRHSNVIRRKPRHWITSFKEITTVFLFPGIMLNQRKSIRMLMLVLCTIRASIISFLPQKCTLALCGITE